MTRLELCSVFIECGLCLGVLFEKLCECREILKGILVGQVTRLQAVEEGWQTSEDSCRQQCLTVGSEEVDKSREKETRGLLFG